MVEDLACSGDCRADLFERQTGKTCHLARVGGIFDSQVSTFAGDEFAIEISCYLHALLLSHPRSGSA